MRQEMEIISFRSAEDSVFSWFCCLLFTPKYAEISEEGTGDESLIIPLRVERG